MAMGLHEKNPGTRDVWQGLSTEMGACFRHRVGYQTHPGERKNLFQGQYLAQP